MNLDSPVPFEQRYELRNQLWLDGPHGGWLALDRLLGRQVVVNLPYRSDDNQSFLQMAQLRARLCHANIVPLYDLGATKDGKPFFTEPYLKTTDLRWLLDDEGKADDVALPRLVSYLLDVCKAVAFIHTSGFLHLELRPGNVLVLPEFQEVFVVCEHLSLPPVGGKERCSEWAVCGVPAYMAPEQVYPERLGPTDALTDVYGLGGILFEFLYDNPPNGRRHSSVNESLTVLATRKGPPEPGTFGRRAARYRELAQKLEPICLRALEYDRTARTGSVSAFMKEVEQCAWGWAIRS
jgi:eukaryotic-like serine/threonine-protein kinase